jgi:hypothetical protein
MALEEAPVPANAILPTRCRAWRNSASCGSVRWCRPAARAQNCSALHADAPVHPGFRRVSGIGAEVGRIVP